MILLPVVSGILLALAFPKFSLWWLAWVALVPLFWVLIQSKSGKESLLYSFLFGITFFGIDFFWVTSLYRFAGWWVVLGWGVLVLFQTLFILLFVVIGNVLSLRLKIGKAILTPVVWTAVEWLRAWGPFGVTGGDVGYSQVQLLPLLQIASFATVYGVSFLVVLFNASVAQVLVNRKKWHALSMALLLVLIAMGYGIWVTRPAPPHPTVKLALIQPNIDQMDKMNPNKVFSIYEVHEKLTHQATKDKPDIIIWPETSVFTYLLHDRVLLPRVKQLAVDSRAWLIIGTPHYDQNGKVYNSIVSISPNGEIVSRYDKQQLVPFGEYLPFRRFLYPILKGVGYYDQVFDSNPIPVLLSAGKVEIAAAICFESTFPGLIKARTQKDSDFILVVTNDAWFDDSSAPYFHLDTGVLRAVENHKYFVQMGNTGFSAVIDPYGRVLKKTKLNQREILTFEIPLSQNHRRMVIDGNRRRS